MAGGLRGRIPCLARGPGPNLPTWAAGVVLGALFAVAVAVTASESYRRGRGVEGPSHKVGVMYGRSWALALAVLFTVNVALAREGLSSALPPLVGSGSALLVVGLLYLAAGMLWCDRVQYALGAWTLVVGAASVFAGAPGNYAVLSLAGGGGFLVAAALSHANRRRARRTKAPK